MHWPQKVRVVRVDGENSLLILKDPPLGLTPDRFDHSFASELLRSAVVSAVSSMDRYLHDVAVSRCFTLLNGAEKDLPKKLAKLEMPAISAFKATKALRKDARSRPGNQLKKALQEKLHSITFQSPAGIEEFCQLVGIKDFWRKIETEMGGGLSPDEMKSMLLAIVRRRNQIVHEADLERQIKARRFAIREIEENFAHHTVDLIQKFVKAIEAVCLSEFRK